VSLEDEATRLRAEVAALQDEIRWLTGQDEDPPSWLTRGWVRASLLLTAVGLAALVSLPYLLHVEAPVAAVRITRFCERLELRIIRISDHSFFIC
jgi:hypothetical protein